MRYLTQRYSMPYDDVRAALTDIGTEELAHLEMICAMVHQLTRDLTPEEIKKSGFDKYFVDHTAAVYPIAAAGLPWRAEYIQAKGDILADLHEDMAADATTTEEQPLFSRARKPLIRLGFRHFEGFRKNGIPATT